MDPELYLKKHHIMTYIEDVVGFLLERKDEDSKTKPFEVLAEYFKSVKSGTHVLFREFSFVSTTPHNRASFIRAVWQSYTEVAASGRTMKAVEFLSLLRLICHDFPSDMVQTVGKIIFSHNTVENVATFPEFLYTFQVVFYYEYFLSQCERLHSSIASGHPHHALLGTTVVVPIPSLADQDSRPGTSQGSRTKHDAQLESSKHVDAAVYLKAVVSLVQRLGDREPWQSFPSQDGIREALGGITEFCFYDFVLALSRSERVNVEIGVLPPRAEFSQTLSSLVGRPLALLKHPDAPRAQPQ